MVVRAQTCELLVRFGETPAARAAATKRQLLAWLAHHGVDNIIEAVCDGIHDLLPEDAHGEALFDESIDHTPLAVYDASADRLADLKKTLSASFPDARLEFLLTSLSDEAWSQAWDEAADTMTTRRFFVSLAARHVSVPKEHIPIVISSGEAFGDGRHATTLVALEVLEALPGRLFAGRCLDVGTGTGILSIAAFKLGCHDVCGTDLDADIIAEARANAELNQVTMRLMVTNELPQDGLYTIIAANILAPVLHQLMSSFAARLAPEGALVLAGFIEKEARPIIARAERCGLLLTGRRERRGWVGLWFTKIL